MKIVAIALETQSLSAWRHGTSREVARTGHWRASVARIDEPGAFTAFPGMRRQIALLDGGPLTLDWVEHSLVVEPRLTAKAFEGDPPPIAADDIPCTVFNLIYRQVEAKLLPRPLVGAMVLFNEPAVDWLVYLHSGEATLRWGENNLWLGSQHAALIEGDHSGGRAVLDGGGEVVLCRLGRA